MMTTTQTDLDYDKAIDRARDDGDLPNELFNMAHCSSWVIGSDEWVDRIIVLAKDQDEQIAALAEKYRTNQQEVNG